MEDLNQLQQARIEALEKRNAYLEKEFKRACAIFQDMINDWEVNEAETVKP